MSVKPKPKTKKPNKPHTFKKKPNGKNDTGRPPVVIEVTKIKYFSRFMPTDEELAALMNISYATFKVYKSLNPEVAEAMAEGQAMGRASLRGKQFELAMKGNVALLIWTGKQYLDQKERSLLGSDPNHPLPSNNPVIPITSENIKAIAAAIHEEF